MKKKFLLFVIPLLMTIIWFHQGKVLGWSEEGIPFYSALKMISHSASLWVPIETGIFAIDLYPRLTLAWLFIILTKIGISAFLFQASIIYILIITGTFSTYYLLKTFLKGSSSQATIVLIASIFYFLNPYSMTQIWQRGLYAQYFMFALLPLSLLLFVLGLERKDIRMSFIIVLSSVIFSTTFGLVTNVIVLWSVLFAYFIYWMLKNHKQEDISFGVFFFLVTCIFWVLTQSWWLVPVILFKEVLFGFKGSNAANNISGVIAVSNYFPFTAVIRLIQNFIFYTPHVWSISYANPVMELISLLPPTMLFVGILFIKRAKTLSFFFFLLVIGLFISLGSNLPLGFLFLFLFKNLSFFQAFRNPYEKYGIVLMLAYSPLFAFGLFEFSLIIQRFTKRIAWWPPVGIVLFLTGVIYLWPMWADIYKPAINLPQEYNALNAWFAKNEHEKSSRIFIIPFLGEGILNDWGYNGIESTLFTINQPSLSYTLQTAYTFDIFHNINNYMGQINLFPVLALLDGKYIVTRKDVVGVDMKQLNDINTELIPNHDLASIPFCIGQQYLESVTCAMSVTSIDQLKNQYLDIVLKTNIPSSISVQLQNQGYLLTQWSDTGNTEFVTQANIDKELLFPINTTFAPNPSANIFSPKVIINATSLSKNTPTITIENMQLVPYTKQTLNEDRLVFEKGKLAVFALNKTQFQKPIVSLSLVREEPTFRDFFNQVGLDRDNISHTGYIVDGQNTNKDISIFTNFKLQNQIRSENISSTRFYIQTSSHDGTILAFNQTFNPLWKVVIVKNQNELLNTFMNDIHLIHLSFLSEDKHVIGNGYENFWLLPKGQDKYGIIFLPQVYSDAAMYVSFLSVSLLLLLCFGSFIRKFLYER